MHARIQNILTGGGGGGVKGLDVVFDFVVFALVIIF